MQAAKMLGSAAGNFFEEMEIQLQVENDAQSQYQQIWAAWTHKKAKFADKFMNEIWQ